MDILCEKVKDLARSTGEYLKSEQPKLKKKDIELKGARDYVTYIDKEAENMLVKGLMEIFPNAGFLTEEETVDFEEKEYTWIIDPLDGTSNYVHGDTPFCVSIALKHNNDIVLGVVYDPIADDMYSATSPKDVQLNNKPIRVSEHSTIKNAYLGFGVPYVLNESGERVLKNAIKLFNTCTFRIKGAAAIELCYVAAGITDTYFHSGLSPWDVAAGSFILQCAGGKCTDYSGSNNYLYGKEIVASNNVIHEEIMKHIIIS
ncbi:MAG TPA: inositol monophosphatase family protein [Fermentimonas sp.]|nr:inositol monophosphatase family protein [Fermentimonas sp.]